MKYTAPIDVAWEWLGDKPSFLTLLAQRLGLIAPKKGLHGLPAVFGCPDCGMPVDKRFQESNVRIEKSQRILSCPWCHRVFNLGAET